MDELRALPARMSSLEEQLAQHRAETRIEFSAVREEMRTGFTTLRQEIRDGDEETRRQMRVLHEDVIGRIATLGESLDGDATRKPGRARPRRRNR